MMDSMGPGKLVRHMQNLLYTYDEYLICIGLICICKNLSYSGPSYPSSPVLHNSVLTDSLYPHGNLFLNVLFLWTGYPKCTCYVWSIFSFPFLREDNNYIHKTTINKYLLYEKRHNIFIQCHWNYIKMKKYNHLLCNLHFKGYLTKNLGVLRGDFWGVGCPCK